MYKISIGVVNKKLHILKETEKDHYNSGTVNVDEIEFNFNDSEWDNLTKVATFITPSGATYNVALIDNICTVPPEVYKEVGEISIGVYGYTIENNELIKVLPSNLVTKKIHQGAYQIGNEPGNLPTPTQWDAYIVQINGIIAQAEEDLSTAISDAIGDEY